MSVFAHVPVVFYCSKGLNQTPTPKERVEQYVYTVVCPSSTGLASFVTF